MPNMISMEHASLTADELAVRMQELEDKYFIGWQAIEVAAQQALADGFAPKTAWDGRLDTRRRLSAGTMAQLREVAPDQPEREFCYLVTTLRNIARECAIAGTPVEQEKAEWALSSARHTLATHGPPLLEQIAALQASYDELVDAEQTARQEHERRQKALRKLERDDAYLPRYLLAEEARQIHAARRRYQQLVADLGPEQEAERQQLAAQRDAAIADARLIRKKYLPK